MVPQCHVHAFNFHALKKSCVSDSVYVVQHMHAPVDMRTYTHHTHAHTFNLAYPVSFLAVGNTDMRTCFVLFPDLRTNQCTLGTRNRETVGMAYDELYFKSLWQMQQTCLSVCPTVCLSVCLQGLYWVLLSVCLPSGSVLIGLLMYWCHCYIGSLLYCPIGPRQGKKTPRNAARSLCWHLWTIAAQSAHTVVSAIEFNTGRQLQHHTDDSQTNHCLQLQCGGWWGQSRDWVGCNKTRSDTRDSARSRQERGQEDEWTWHEGDFM